MKTNSALPIVMFMDSFLLAAVLQWLSFCFSVPVAAKRPQKPRRLKTQPRRSAAAVSAPTTTALHADQLHAQHEENNENDKTSTLIKQCLAMHLFRGRKCCSSSTELWSRYLQKWIGFMTAWLSNSLLPSLHSVMSLIILFSFIAFETQLFI